jgi:hypothetical protein
MNTKSMPIEHIVVDACEEPLCSRALASRLAEQFSASFRQVSKPFPADISSSFLERQRFLALKSQSPRTNHSMTQRLVERAADHGDARNGAW